MDGGKAAHARVARLEFHARDTVCDRAGPRAAEAAQVHAENAEVAQLAAERDRKRPLFKPLRDLREHSTSHERANGVANHPFFVGE